MKYKKGDKLIVIDEICGHEFPIGTEVTVLEVSEYNYKAEDSTGEYWYLNDLEVKKSEEI